MGGDSGNELEKRENPECTVFQQFASLNVHSENSFVKIGDEFNFSKNVLIVVPDPDGENKTKKVEKRRKNCARDTVTNEKLNRTKLRLFGDWLRRLSTTRRALFALIFAIAAGLILLIALISRNDGSSFEIPDYVNRSVWGDQPIRCSYPRLEKPVSWVILQHTKGVYCCNFTECQQSVKNSQNWHLSLPYYCDVRFGFLVGGDCRIYEGRNFSQKDPQSNDLLFNSTVEVAFIGNYSRDRPSDCQIQHFLKFLDESVSAGFLDRDFKVVGGLQAYVYEHESPGKYLMDEMTRWSMWSNKTLFRR